MPKVRVVWTCGLHRCIRKTQTLRSSYLSSTSTMFDISRADPNETLIFKRVYLSLIIDQGSYSAVCILGFRDGRSKCTESTYELAYSQRTAVLLTFGHRRLTTPSGLGRQDGATLAGKQSSKFLYMLKWVANPSVLRIYGVND